MSKVTWHRGSRNEYTKKASTQRHAEEDHGVKVPGGKDVCTCQMPNTGKEQRSSTRYRNFIILLFLHNDLYLPSVTVAVQVQSHGRGLNRKEAGSMWRSWILHVPTAICILLPPRLVSTCTGECSLVVNICISCWV